MNRTVNPCGFMKLAGKPVAIFLLLLPPAAYFWSVIRFSSNRPFGDDYDAILAFMNEFLSAPVGTRLSLLPAQHNEHRIVLDRVVAIADYLFSGRISFTELNFLGNLGLIAVFLIVARSAPRDRKSIAALVPISFLCFNFAQWDLMYFPMAAIEQFWQAAFALAALSVLSISPGARGVAGGAALGAVAAFTSGGGLLVFPVGLYAFAARRRWRGMVVWLGLSALVFFVYFVSLHYEPTPLSIKSATLARHDPVGWLLYVLAFSGNSMAALTHADGIAILVGAFFTVYIAVTSIGILLEGHASDAQADSAFGERLRLVLFGLFIIASATAAGHGRLAFGVGQAMSSRYTIYGLLALAVTYLLWLSKPSQRRPSFVKGVFLILSACLFTVAFHRGLVPLKARYEQTMDTIAYPSDARARAEEILRRSAKMGVYVLPPANGRVAEPDR